MVRKLPNYSLSQKADEILYLIYQEYLSRQTSDYMKTFSIDSLFPYHQNSEILSALIELSKCQMIKFFSDRRITLNDEAISYIENKKIGNIKNL